MDNYPSIKVIDIGPNNSAGAGKGLGYVLEQALMEAHNYQPTHVDPPNSPSDDCE